LARDLAIDYPVVGLDDDALAAAHLLVERHLPGLVVMDGDWRPMTVLPGSQVVRFLVPGYVQDDPALARVVDEMHADRLCASLSGKRVSDLLPHEAPVLPVVGAGDTALEIAAVMAQAHSPLVAVVSEDGGTGGQLLGVVTASRLLERLLTK